MKCSAARLSANRANSLKSCGPKTEEGKARSRANAYKHGMTGDGIARPDVENETIEAQIAAIEAPLIGAAPALARRFAVLNERLERLERRDRASTAKRVRDARATFLENRQQDADDLVDLLADEPAFAVRGLRATPEGCDRLISLWADLARDLALAQPWTQAHRDLALSLSGRKPGAIGLSLIEVLSVTLGGGTRLLPHDPADPQNRDPARLEALRKAARRDLGALIDGEAADLIRHKSAFSAEDRALDLEEAAERALYDDSPEAALFRRYEMATERHLYKALKKLEEAAAQAAEPQPESEVATDDSAPLASFGAEREEEPQAPSKAKGPDHSSVPPSSTDLLPGGERASTPAQVPHLGEG